MENEFNNEEIDFTRLSIEEIIATKKANADEFITRVQAVNMIFETKIKGTFFGVSFIKRTDGTFRDMQARLNVKKHLKGGVCAYNFESKELISCFDMQKGFRAIPYEGIIEVRTKGKNYFVID